MSKIIGIDLGTTNCCVAVYKDGKPVVIPNGEGRLTMPSVVSFEDDGSSKVGFSAKRQSITNPCNTIFSIKRFMGESYIGLSSEEKKNKPYKVLPGKDGIPCVKINGKLMTPQSISALLIKKIKKIAEDYLGEAVSEAIITVPAYFDASQRQATIEAGEMAGMVVRRIISEPTAAALVYGKNKKILDYRDCDKNVAVVHLGGGSLDVSIVNMSDGVCDVRYTIGNTHLGGDDFDNKIINWLVDEFEKKEGLDLRNDPTAMQRLKEVAEKSKCELTDSQEAVIELPYIAVSKGKPLHLKKTLTRACFEQMCADLIDKVKGLCMQALNEFSERDNLGKVVLVGGATRIPAIQNAVQDCFKLSPSKDINPDEAVAQGAAILGGILSGEIRDILLLDVVPISLGIETLGGVMTRLINANTSIPTIGKQIFSTAADNQPEVEINVLQGEHSMANMNKSIGRILLMGIPPAPKGVPQIEVTFDIDCNGVLMVGAVEIGSGKSVRVQVVAPIVPNEHRAMQITYNFQQTNQAERRQEARNSNMDSKAKQNIDSEQNQTVLDNESTKAELKRENIRDILIGSGLIVGVLAIFTAIAFTLVK